MEKKANHQVNIVRITEIKEHTNADILVIIPIGGYQVVSKKGQFNVGDLGVYIQPDSVVPQTEPFKFIWQPYFDDIANNPLLCKHVDPATGSLTVVDGDHEVCLKCHHVDPFKVPEKKRRITVRKFRKEWSEGLLLPLSDFPTVFTFRTGVEGEDVSDLLGITHYDPDTEDGSTEYAPKRKKKRYPKTFRGWVSFILAKFRFWKGKEFLEETDSLGIPTYDVDSYKARPADFQEGEPVRISEKLHGSNARYLFLDGVMYVGSRNKWTAPGSANPFRNALKLNPWIEEWCRAHEGYVLWGEVTGVQKGYDYGKKEHQFFVFDVYTPQGNWVNESTPEGLEMLTHLQAYTVPVLYKGPYQGYNHVKTFVDGPSAIKGANHIREGVVVATTTRPDRHQRKIVSNVFLEKDNK